MPYSVKTREELSLELHREQSFILIYIPAFNRNIGDRRSGRLDARFPLGNQNSSNSPLGGDENTISFISYCLIFN
jgi:hypothetical protein